VQNPWRALGVGLSVIAGLGAGTLTASTLRVRRATEAPPEIDRAAAMRAFETERAVATELHFVLAEEAQAPAEKSGAIGGVWSHRLSIGARECVAVIATTYGNHRPVALALQARSDDDLHISTGMIAPLSLTRADGGLVAQVQWCDAEEHTRVAIFETLALTSRVFERPLTATVHFAVYRAPWDAVGGTPRLRRGVLASWALRQFPPAYALDESRAHVPRDGRLLGVPVPIRPDGARLLPANAATYESLYERVRSGRDVVVNPRIDPSRPLDEPWGTGLPVDLTGLYQRLRGERDSTAPADPVFAVGDRHRRVLAVVDTAHLGAPCVGLMFTRVFYEHRAVVWRHEPVATDDGHPLDALENSVLDRRCPARGIAVYSVDDRDQEDWILRVFALPTPADPVAAEVAPTASETEDDAPGASHPHGSTRRHRRTPRRHR
jgi:hypothetical protein